MRVVGPITSHEVTGEHVLIHASSITIAITALEEDVIRVHAVRDEAGKTWMVAPEGHAPYEGRPKDCCSGFTQPKLEVREEDRILVIATSRMRILINLDASALALRWEWRDVASGGGWRPLFADRRTGAYYTGRHDERIAHHIARRRGDRFYGLGEKSGALDKAGRRYRMDCLDAMGYNAETSDPLYKFWPFYIAKPAPASSGSMEPSSAYGIFYDNLASCSFDLGCAFDNYHGLFTSYEAVCGGLDYYVILGPAVAQVTRRFAWLTGGHCLPPAWSLGYSGSTMTYTDAPNAQERMQQFVELCATHDVPCSSFQMSSGYTSIGTKRYVFNWNRSKFPDPKAFAQSYAAAGLHLAANIKPCLLIDHPMYEACAAAGLFLRDSSPPTWELATTPETSMFWDAVGSHLDFTNPATAAWWKRQVREQLLELGIGSTWNDNNEWHVDDESAWCHGFGTPTPLRYLRPVHALLMVQCSHDAQVEHQPTLRPWLISRSGMPGTQRYAQTWSGDNYTSWHTLRYNIRMGLGLSLSGYYNIGHDVGGFAGPAPEPELLVRWVQNGCFHPRFTIHSWNTDLDGTPDGTCNEPWMFTEALPMVRDAIRLRYALIPHLYHLLRQAVAHHEPLLRPVFLDHEDDPRAWEETDDFLLGQELLVASVVEPGQRQRPVYLPQNHGRGWWDWHRGEWHAGGQTVVLAAPLERCPLLVRGGSMIILAEAAKSAATPSQSAQRTLRVFPPPIGTPPSEVALTWTEDDGETVEGSVASSDKLVLSCTMRCSDERLELDALVTAYGPGRWRRWDEIVLELPRGERRPLIISSCELRGFEDAQHRAALRFRVQ